MHNDAVVQGLSEVPLMRDIQPGRVDDRTGLATRALRTGERGKRAAKTRKKSPEKK